MKINAEIQIKELDSQNDLVLDEALSMMNRTQGVNLFSKNYLTSKIHRKDALALGAFVNGDLVGVACAELLSNFSYYTPFEKDIEQRLKNQIVGSLCTLCVREDLQGKGIGQILSKERLNWLKQQDCMHVLGISWLSGLQNTSDRVFQKVGFKMISEVSEFYKESAIAFPFDCPGCRIQPCRCSAALYQHTF